MAKQGKASRMRQAARERATGLGPIVDAPPARGYREADRSPRAGSDQAYVVAPAGTVFHPVWCRAVGERWDSNPKSLHVVDAATVGLRSRCRICEDDGPIAD